MAKNENKFVIEGELVSAPSWGFRYARTRKMFGKMLKTFEYDHYGQNMKPFEGIVDMNTKDGDLKLTVRASRTFARAGGDGWDAEAALMDMTDKLEDHCQAYTSGKEKAEDRAKEEGVLELAWITNVKQEE